MGAVTGSDSRVGGGGKGKKRCPKEKAPSSAKTGRKTNGRSEQAAKIEPGYLVFEATWRVPRSVGEAAQGIKAYLRRWSVEDSGRASNRLVGIEDVRVQSLRAIVRLVRLAGMALGRLCLLVLFAPRTVAEILGRAKTVGREPLFLACRLL